MKFSIVTPTYNHKKYIDATIKSVLENKKNYPNVEYIVIDGNSKDGTQDVVKSYGKEIDVFVSEPDDGQSDAINKGFTYATGEIYAYINSDDYYYPQTFKKVAKIFEENPNIDVVYGNCTFVTEDEQFFRYFTEVEPYDEYRLRSCTDFIMQPTCFWRKEIYDKCEGFTKDFHFGFDWEMWCRMAKNGAKFHYEPELFAVNREFEETKTSTGGDIRLKELKEINKLHMMSSIPHAYYSYKHATLINDYRLEDNIIKKIFLKLEIYFYKLIGFKNIIYNQRNFLKKDMYGILSHTNIIKKKARLSIPYYKNSVEPIIMLRLYSDIDDQAIEISLNNENIKATFVNNQIVLLYKLKNFDKNEINIDLTFEKEKSVYLRKLYKLLGRKKYISGIISDFHIYSNNDNVLEKFNDDGYYISI